MSININDISDKIDILATSVNKVNNQLDQINIPYISNFINNILPNINNQLLDSEHTNIIHQSSINNIKDDHNKLKNNHTTLYNNTQNIETKILNTNTLHTNLSNNYNDLSSNFNNKNAIINQHDNNISNISDQISNFEDEISNLKLSVMNIQNNIDNYTIQINKQNQQISQVDNINFRQTSSNAYHAFLSNTIQKHIANKTAIGHSINNLASKVENNTLLAIKALHNSAKNTGSFDTHTMSNK